MIKVSEGRLQTVCLLFITTVLATFAAYWLRPVLVPLVLAVFIVNGVTPILEFLEKSIASSRFTAAVIAFLVGSLVMVMLMASLWASVVDLSKNWATYEAQLQLMMRNLRTVLPMPLEPDVPEEPREKRLGERDPPLISQSSPDIDDTADSESSDKEDSGTSDISTAEELPVEAPPDEKSGDGGSPPEQPEGDPTDGSSPTDDSNSENVGQSEDNSAPREQDEGENAEQENPNSSETNPPDPSSESTVESSGASEESAETGELVARPLHRITPVDSQTKVLAPEVRPKTVPSDNDTFSRLLTNTVRAGFFDMSQLFLQMISSSVIVLIYVFFLMLGVPNPSARPQVLNEIDRQIRSYLSLKSVISVLTGCVFGLTLWFFGIPMALAFGVMACFLNFIPNIGPIIASLLPLPLIILQPGAGILWIVLVVALTSTIQFVSGNVIEPRLMGKSSDLHPIVVLVALMFWGMLWGVVGMFLAVPITSGIRIALNEFEQTQGIAEMMAGRWPEQLVVVSNSEGHESNSGTV
ncbi:AI-2 transport protein TqsA [Thalassoglobus neptunius]|uniref:AI-2 transport protein TqsA n=1 Tax=Thalassoglobus neptunius TaxID=1938619 RepID=A0A5C5WP18_9PLAN|nr:AI-2E family transporter [Thalassoglobus neptunius]TWT51879.1 AI-2 transport protein TqsA [Thalassoglobus neptunius]